MFVFFIVWVTGYWERQIKMIYVMVWFFFTWTQPYSIGLNFLFAQVISYRCSKSNWFSIFCYFSLLIKPPIIFNHSINKIKLDKSLRSQFTFVPLHRVICDHIYIYYIYNIYPIFYKQLFELWIWFLSFLRLQETAAKC